MKYKLREWKYKEMLFWMDGGTISIICVNDTENELTIDLQQRIITEYHEVTKIPGRIYVNDEIVVKRSIDEEIVLEFLEQIIKDQIKMPNSQALMEEIKWIKSLKYMNFNPKKMVLSEKRKKHLLSQTKTPEE